MEKTSLKLKVLNIFNAVKEEVKTPHKDFNNILIKCAILYIFAFLSIAHYAFAYLTVLIAGCFIAFEKSARSVYYVIFLLPFLNVLRRTASHLYLLILLWCLILIILGIKLFISFFIKKDKKINWLFTSLVAVFLVYIIAIGPLNFTNHGAAFLTIAIMYVLYYYLDELSFKEIIFVFFWGSVLGGFSGFFRPLFDRAQEIIPLFMEKTAARFNGVSNDPNYYSGDLAVLLAGFMILYLKKDIKYIFYPAMLLLTIFALLSLSKMMLVIYGFILVVFCLFVLIRYRWKKGFIKCLAITGCFLLSCVICTNQILSITGRLTRTTAGVKQELVIPSDTPEEENGEANEELSGEYFVYEFRNNALTVLTTGRTNIWLAYLEESFSSVKYALFGHGVGAPFILCDNGYKIGYLAEHNTFVQMIYRLGIVGSVLLLLVVASTFKKQSIKKVKLDNLFILVVMGFLFISLCNLLSFRLSIYLTILFLSLVYSGYTKEEEPKFIENLPKDKLKDNKEEKKLSVIIPVKNGEKYIKNCINSVLDNSGLTEEEIEIIVVNDGSTDGTEKVVSGLNSKAVKLTQNAGQGVSDARNTGINVATGEYLTFLDADDIVDSNFKMAINLLNREKADLYQFAFVYDVNGKLDQKNNYKKELCGKVHTPKDKSFKKLCKNYYNGVWSKLVRRDFIVKNNLCFKKYSVAEDMEWGVRVIMSAGTVYVTDLAYYHYIKYPTSVMGTASLAKTIDAINACEEAMMVVKNSNLEPQIKRALNVYISKTAYSTMQFYKKLTKEDKKKFKEQLYEKTNLFVLTNKPKFVLIKTFLIIFGIDATLVMLSKI